MQCFQKLFSIFGALQDVLMYFYFCFSVTRVVPLSHAFNIMLFLGAGIAESV
jgi:hypothetical protein